MASAGSVAALLDFVREHGPLKHAYPALRQSLVGRLEQESDPHSLVLAAIQALLTPAAAAPEGASSNKSEAPWPGSGAHAYCSLLLEAAAKMELVPAKCDRERAATLATSHPQMFRKLTETYRGDGTQDASLAVAKQLLDSGDSAEAALLAVEYGLLGSFDTVALVKAVAATNKANAVTALLGAQPALQLVLTDHYVATGQHKQALRLLLKYRLHRTAPA